MPRIKNAKHKNATLTTFQEQVCLGTILGDSSLSCPKNGINYHMSCYHSQRQIDWLQTKWGWLQPHARPIQYCEYLDRRDGKIRAGGRFHTISAPCFTKLHELFCGNGKKAIDKQLIDKINHPVALACLICDDGSWDRAGIQIASKQFTEIDNRILANGLMLAYQIEAYPYQTGKYWSIRIPAISVERVRELCFPFIPDSMKYKFGGDYYATRLVSKVEANCAICNNLFYAYKSSGRVYCSRECAMQGKKSGYETRTKQIACMRCKATFLQYNKRVKLCPDCKGKRIKSIPCVICGNPVMSVRGITCSKSCSVALGHKNRK